MGVCAPNLMVKMLKSAVIDSQNLLTKIAHTLLGIHKRQSNEIQEVRNKYAPQKEALQNQMKSTGDILSSEYMECMMELNELRNKEESEIETVQQEVNDIQSKYELQQETEQTTLSARKADLESFEQMRDDNIKEEFNIFNS